MNIYEVQRSNGVTRRNLVVEWFGLKPTCQSLGWYIMFGIADKGKNRKYPTTLSNCVTIKHRFVG